MRSVGWRARCWIESHLCILAILELARNPEIFPLEAGFVQAIGDASSDQILVVVSWITV